MSVRALACLIGVATGSLAWPAAAENRAPTKARAAYRAMEYHRLLPWLHKSPGQIEAETRRIKAELGDKIFIAGEYAHPNEEEARARELGAAAMRGGADGFGNGA